MFRLHLLLSILLWTAFTSRSVAQDFVTLPSANYPVGEGELPLYTTQLKLGSACTEEEVRILVEYPEYEVLSASEARLLETRRKEFGETVTPQIVWGRSRGQLFADVSFVPIVYREGRFMRLTGFKLRVDTLAVSPVSASRVAGSQPLAKLSTGRYAGHSVLQNGRWVKIRVRDAGLYQLTSSDLSRMGFEDMARVRLYGYGGRVLPENFDFSGVDGLIDDLNEQPLYRRDGSLLFFAEGTVRFDEDGEHRKNTYSDYSYYFLTEGDAPATFTTAAEPDGTLAEIDEVKRTALVDFDEYAWYEGGRDFYEAREIGSSGASYTLPLPGLVEGSTSTVTWDISAANSSSTSATATLSVAGTSLSSVTIPKAGEGQSARGYLSRITTSGLSAPSATFTVAANIAAHLNYIRVVYTHALSAAGSLAVPFRLDSRTPVQLRVADAGSGTRVWQLPDASHDLMEVPGSLEGTTYTAKVSDPGARFVVVDVNQSYASPEFVGEVANQDLHADSCYDYVMIVPSSGLLREEAERLAQFHEGRGLRVKVVSADLLYNEFASGTPDASAYRRYLKMLYDRAETTTDMPKYLLLFGDCLWDNRLVTPGWGSGTKADDYLLAYECNDTENNVNTAYAVGTLNSYVTDDYFGLLDDGEGSNIAREKLDLAIGRFCCHDVETAAWLVDQAIAYAENKSVGAWKNMVYVIGDNGDENLHMNDAEAVLKQAQTSAGDHVLVRRIYQDAYKVTQGALNSTYPQATAHLKNMMRQGALIFNYNGHGSPSKLSHRDLLYAEDMAANVSEARPLWVFASCEITPYDQQVDDLGRAALYNRQGGAVAVICAARSVYSGYNRSLNVAFVKHVFSKDPDGNRNSMGEALRLAKCDMVSSSGGDRTINKLKYVLLGDPALPLSYADAGVVLDSIDGQPVVKSENYQLRAGSVVTIGGYVGNDDSAVADAPDTSFNGVLTGTFFDAPSTVVCKGNGNSSASPLQYTDYSKMLYQGSVSVTDGRFTLRMMVPYDISYSDVAGMVNLYAVRDDCTGERGGMSAQVHFNGTAAGMSADTLSPEVYVYLDTPDFPDGGKVGTSAQFYATVSDSTAIAIAGGNLGHEMQLVIDGDASSAVSLNDFFTFDLGSFSSGTVQYPLNGLAVGRHELQFTVWDVYDNATTASLRFSVGEEEMADFDVYSTQSPTRDPVTFITRFPAADGTPASVRVEVYSLTGQCVWSSSQNVSAGGYASTPWNLTSYSGSRLAPGVYLYRSKVNDRWSKTKQIVIL